MLRVICLAAGLLCFAAVSNAAVVQQLFLSELFVNSPGTDQSQESVEIQGPPNFSLSGYWLIVIEGDTNPAGGVDQVIDLGSYSTGANGLLLIRDANLELIPGPDVDTNVVIYDFTPDIENGGNTYVFGFGTPDVTVGQDVDADNDGTLDVSLGADFSVVDAVSYVDGDAGGLEYADDVGGIALGDLGTFTPDAIYRILSSDGLSPVDWAGGDVLGSNPGPFPWDPAENFGFVENGFDPNLYGLDLGIKNLMVAGGGPELYHPTSANVIRGTHNSGDVASFAADDDNFWVQSSAYNGADPLAVIDASLGLESATTSTSYTSGSVKTILKANTSNAKYRMRAVRANGSFLVLVDNVASSFTETELAGNLPNPVSDFIDAANGNRIKLEVRCASSNRFAGFFRKSVDLVEWEFTP